MATVRGNFMNRNYKYSKRSLANIASTKTVVGELCRQALVIANTRKMHCPDFVITYGLRSADEQYALYQKGRDFVNGKWVIVDSRKVVTNCDGLTKKSIHQSALAIDFAPLVGGRANFSPEYCALIATCFFEAASNMGIGLDWGGSFRSISDGCHIEVTNYELV